MHLAIENESAVRSYLIADPARSRRVDTYGFHFTPSPSRIQQVITGATWDRVKTRDLGNAAMHFTLQNYRYFDTYVDAAVFASQLSSLPSYEGTVVLLIPVSGSTVRKQQGLSATVNVSGVLQGVSVLQTWQVVCQPLTDEGTEDLGTGDSMGDPTSGDTFGDPTSGDTFGEPTP
jgi:hypothetical protein